LSADRQAHNTNAITGDNQIEYKSTADEKLNHEQPIELYLIASGDGNNASHRYPRKRYCRRDTEPSAHCKACINKATRENNSTRYADGMQKAKETIIKDTQCYVPTKATVHKLQCDLIAIQRAIDMKPDSIQHIKIHVRHTKQT
jgi:hypothetical protein